MTGPALPAWQDVVTCHPDLRDNSADYAIHLGDVLRDASHCPALYKDAHRFFAASYPAAQLAQLLTALNARLHGDDGPRVLRLQAGFGGGKSHTLLALYHWCASPTATHDTPDWAHLPTPPQTRLAALSGLDFDPHTGMTLPNGPTCHTLWGAIAWLLGGQGAWATWATHDQQRAAPGGALLQRLLQGQPTLLLLDELLLYIEKTRAVALGDSTFGKQNLLFLQTLTEVVRGEAHAAMVYSLQSNATEAAGDDELLNALAHLSQRLEAQHQPLQPHELVQVLRRRLFSDLGQMEHHHAAADAYDALWQHYERARGRKKPSPSRRQEFLDCYPFHPATIELLTEQWWNIPTYQRTRGALQLLTQALLAPDALPRQPLLAPGALPITTAWRQRLWGQLGAAAAFEDVVDYELLREESAVQRASTPLHELAPLTSATSDTQSEDTSKRVALATALTTTLLLFSFGGRGATVYGMLASDCCRACLHPDTHPTLVDSTWQLLRETLGYMHEQRSRLRLRTAPNLLYQLTQEGARWSHDQLEAALANQLKIALKGHKATHLWPRTSADIPDGQPHLQVAYLDLPWRETSPQDCLTAMRPWLAQQTSRLPRQYRNGIALLQPSAARWPALSAALREWLSLEAIAADPNTRQSKAFAKEHQTRQTRLDNALPSLALQLYQTLWIPRQTQGATNGYEPESIDLSSWRPNPKAPLEHVRAALVQAHKLSVALTPGRLETLLQEVMPSTGPLTTKRLQDAFFSFLHFPRVASLTPLNEAIEALCAAGTWEHKGAWPTQQARRNPHEGWRDDVTLARVVTQDSAATAERATQPATSEANGAAPSLTMRPSAAQLSSLLTLLKRMQQRADLTAITIEMQLESDAPLSKRWKALVVEDSLEELGIAYEWGVSDGGDE